MTKRNACNRFARACLFIAAFLLGSPSSLLGQQDCGSYWTDSFSEEEEGFAECKSGYAVGAIECSGRYCDNKRLKCIPYTNYCEKDEAAVPSGWSPWFSDGSNPDKEYTDTGWLVGVKCQGRYCDDVSIRTFSSPYLPNPGKDFCQWTSQFSEEQGERACPGSDYVAGLACYGDYCDNLSMYCCTNPYADVEVLDVNYDLDVAEVVENPPEMLAHSDISNHSEATVTNGFVYSETFGESSWFQNAVGIGLEIGRSFSASIPYLDTEGNLALSAEKVREYGVQQETQKEFTGHCSAEVPPCSSVRLEFLVFTSDLDVPYTMYLKSPSTDQTFTRTGVWRGVSAWNDKCESKKLVQLDRSTCE